MSILYRACSTKLQVTNISRLYDIRKSTASGYVDNLEKNGYVKRVKDGENLRNTYVVPTAKGEKWITSKETLLADYVQQHLANLTVKEQQDFLMLLSKFVKEN